MKKITLILLLFITPLCCGCEDLYNAANQDLSALQDADTDTNSDTAPPGPVVLTNTLTKGAESITLNWTDPTDEDLDHILIDWGTSSAIFAKGVGSGNVTGLSPLTDYTFTISAVDTSGNLSAGTALTIETSASGDTEITGTTISNRTELEAISSDLTATYILIEDINLSGGEWTPVGSSSTPFTGTFDGGGHEISDMSISQEVDYQGFFSCTDGAAIQYTNITNILTNNNYCYKGAVAGMVSNSTLKYLESSGALSSYVSGGNAYIGGLAGYCVSSTFSNCHSSAAITSERPYAGGLIAAIDSSTVLNCYATGAVNGNSESGGLIGHIVNNSVIKNCYATGSVSGDGNDTGGLVGCIDNESGTGTDNVVSDCYATGNINGTTYTGGLVGRTYGTTSSGSISNCYATGNIAGSANEVGGLIGAHRCSSVSYCYATGSVNGTGSCAGGLFGVMQWSASATYCYARGSVTSDVNYAGGLIGTTSAVTTASVSTCYCTGSVSCSGANVGGFIGYNDGIGITDCYYDQSLTVSDSYATNITLTLQSNFTNWDFVGESVNGTNDYWSISSSVNNGYPYLTNLVP